MHRHAVDDDDHHQTGFPRHLLQHARALATIGQCIVEMHVLNHRNRIEKQKGHPSPLPSTSEILRCSPLAAIGTKLWTNSESLR